MTLLRVETTNLLEHYLQPNYDRLLVRFSNGKRVDEGEADDVSVDAGSTAITRWWH